jgi:signal transduction histidine kinase
MQRRRASFVTRLFIVLFVLSAVPSLALLGLATWGLHNYVELAGTGGAWGRVGDSGSELLDTLREADPDSLVQVAAARHEEELSRSVSLARRWDLIAGRLGDALPWVALVLGLSLAAVAVWSARQIARGLNRPVAQIVDWAGRLAREEPLPAARPEESVGPREFSQLRDAFRHMADRLAEGKRQALEAERLRGLTEMSRRIAHEIKNPLTPMMLALRQARHFTAEGRIDDLNQSLTVISHEASRLDEMARSFAQLGRLPEGPKSEVDLEELLSQLITSDVPDSVSATLQVEGDVPLVEGHLDALGRAFRNLLGNSVEALSGQAEARIEVTITTHNGDVEVAIADNGPGIATEHRDRLWDPDFTTKRRGTGLGLALVRQTVRAHGGEVSLKDTEEGACFVVRLQLSRAGAG